MANQKYVTEILGGRTGYQLCGLLPEYGLRDVLWHLPERGNWMVSHGLNLQINFFLIIDEYRTSCPRIGRMSHGCSLNITQIPTPPPPYILKATQWIFAARHPMHPPSPPPLSLYFIYPPTFELLNLFSKFSRGKIHINNKTSSCADDILSRRYTLSVRISVIISSPL